MKCSLSFCDKSAMSAKHGYCTGHHAQVFRYKIEPRPLRSRNANIGKCIAPECSHESSRRGYCNAHYLQIWNGKSPEDLTPVWGEGKPCAVKGCGNKTRKNASCGKCTARMNLYGLSIEEFNSLSRECEVCGSESGLTIDHDHDTGAVRGRLCNPCNLTLGRAGDTVDGLMRFVRYLQKNG